MLHAEWAKLGDTCTHVACTPGPRAWRRRWRSWAGAPPARRRPSPAGANPATHAGGDNKGWQVIELVKECAAKCGAHTSRGCCDGAPVHPTVREPGAAMACEHARKGAQPVTPLGGLGALALALDSLCATQHGASCGALTCSGPLGGLRSSGVAAIGAQGAAARTGPPSCPNAPPASEAGLEPGTAAIPAAGLGVGLGVGPGVTYVRVRALPVELTISS